MKILLMTFYFSFCSLSSILNFSDDCIEYADAYTDAWDDVRDIYGLPPMEPIDHSFMWIEHYDNCVEHNLG